MPSPPAVTSTPATRRSPAISPTRTVPRASWAGLVEGLRRRRAEGHAPFTVVSCDNLRATARASPGRSAQFAEARGEADLARWIASAVRFPDSMVDSITPATDDTLRADAARRPGVIDASAPIQRERFVQWVTRRRPWPRRGPRSPRPA